MAPCPPGSVLGSSVVVVALWLVVVVARWLVLRFFRFAPRSVVGRVRRPRGCPSRTAVLLPLAVGLGR
jgi:hypothetical protein